jgi:hypothetical protein
LKHNSACFAAAGWHERWVISLKYNIVQRSKLHNTRPDFFFFFFCLLKHPDFITDYDMIHYILYTKNKKEREDDYTLNTTNIILFLLAAAALVFVLGLIIYNMPKIKTGL